MNVGRGAQKEANGLRAHSAFLQRRSLGIDLHGAYSCDPETASFFPGEGAFGTGARRQDHGEQGIVGAQKEGGIAGTPVLAEQNAVDRDKLTLMVAAKRLRGRHLSGRWQAASACEAKSGVLQCRLVVA